MVFSGFCKIEQGGGMPVMYVSDTMGVLPAKNLPWRPWMGLVERDKIFGQIHFEFLYISMPERIFQVDNTTLP